MGEIIEHEDNGNPTSVIVGETDSRVSVKVYQDIYHQVTGRTEQIRKRYPDHLLIDISEIEQLHHKIFQLCDVHNVVARNEVVSVFHDKERKEQFTSFERFSAYNANSSSPSVNVVLKYNFSIVPAKLDRPQEYVVTIRLTSRVALMKQIEEEAPPFFSTNFSFVHNHAAEVTIEYADYIIARGFLEAFEEWVHGCKATPNIPSIMFLQKWSHIIPKTTRVGAATATMLFALRAVPEFFGVGGSAELWARFFVVFSGSFYLITSLAGTAGTMIEQAIDNYPFLSYLKLNKGDERLIKDFFIRKRRVFMKFFFGCFLTVVLGVISSKLANLV